MDKFYKNDFKDRTIVKKQIVMTDSTITRNFIESMGQNVLLTDTDEASGLSNFCYRNDCVFDGSMENESIVKQCRGIVFDGDEMVMKAFSYTDEYSDRDNSILYSIINSLEEPFYVFDSWEGALIRMFYHNDKWYITTHRKLNAFKSKWASGESYGASFKKALAQQMMVNDVLQQVTRSHEYDDCLVAFENYLNKDRQYMFLVSNSSSNRIVCNALLEPTMFHVGTFIDGTLDVLDYINIKKPKQHEFSSANDIMAYVSSIDYMVNPGVIVVTKNRQFKVSNSHYLDLVKLRGNQPSVKFRYLQVRLDNVMNTRLRMLYPEYVGAFNQYEADLHVIAKSIHTAYMNRFIHKQYVTVAVADYQIVKQAHSWFNEDRVNRKVTQRVIYDILNKQSDVSLNHLIKKLRAPIPVENTQIVMS